MTRIYKSLYPSPPPLPPTNIHHVFNPPGSQSKDHVLQIDGLTGFRRTKNEFFERVRNAATALSIPASEGGPGIGLGRKTALGEKGSSEEVIGIFSHNCLVRAYSFSMISSYNLYLDVGTPGSNPCSSVSWDALRTYPRLLYTI